MENKCQRSTYFPRENYDHLRTQSKGSRDSGVNGWPRCGWEDIASLYVEARRSRDGDPYDWIQRYVLEETRHTSTYVRYRNAVARKKYILY